MHPARQRIARTVLALLCFLAAGPALVTGGAQAQEPAASPAGRAPDVPADTYADAGVEALLERARAARHEAARGLRSYEATLRQRIHVGLAAARFRRTRSLFRHERLARIRWEADGTRVVQWEGVRTAIPIVGIDTGRPDDPAVSTVVTDSTARIAAGEELGRDMAEELLEDTELLSFAFDPADDHLRFADEEWALHPLSDSAAAHYRFASGDTIRVEFPMQERVLELREVLVEPRRADVRLIAGSLWFDAETAALVRATYKPARPFILSVDDPEESSEVPGFLQPVEAEIDYVSVEYSLQELRYWLPRRFAFQGEARLGSIVRFPVTLEWEVRGYLVNEEATDLSPATPLPEGWRMRIHVRDEEPHDTVVVIVPTEEELRSATRDAPGFDAPEPTTFDPAELEALEERLERLLPAHQRLRPTVDWGLSPRTLRFNRVEGLSLGATARVPLGVRTDVGAELRYGIADGAFKGTLRLGRGRPRGRWILEGYHDLRSMSEAHDPFSITSSLTAVTLGSDRGEYYLATGLAAGYGAERTSVRWRVEGFLERQRPVSFGTDFYLLRPVRERTVLPVMSADSLTLSGVRGTLSWFRGADPWGWVWTAELKAEAAGGDAAYRRATAALSAAHPIVRGLAGAVEVAGGWSGGALPVQRSFFLGGDTTLRGFHTNAFHGEVFWRLRGELGTAFPAARVALFSDWGWVGPRSAHAWRERRGSVGVGVSLLDGLVRADLARAVRGGADWRVHLYVDAIF